MSTGGKKTTSRIAGIDVLKGLALFAIMCQHGLTNQILHDVFADFWIRQAVPVLFVLMGYNAVRSELRRPRRPLAASYGRAYWRGRAERLLLPFAIAFAAALVVGAATDRVDVGKLNAVGALPVPGPGNYFLTILLTFTLLWPAWMALFRRRPGLVVLAAIAVNVAFELVARHVPSFTASDYPYGYDAALPRYMAAIAIGMWLALDDGRSRRRRLVVCALVPVSVVFIAIARNDPGDVDFLIPGFTLTTNFLAVPLSAAICLVALRLWPAQGMRGTGWLERTGAASFEIFLVQIIWFAVLPGRGDLRILADIAVCSALGIVLHLAVDRIVKRSRRAQTPTGGARAADEGSNSNPSRVLQDVS